jgi:pSer/pThr/pTyr-binding forkhead associated (FHA) protein
VIRLTALIELDGQAPRALTHESKAQTIIMGRDSSADFQIPLSTVSRQHVRITITDKVYVIEDLNSTHGTLVNGRKLDKGEKKVLRDGDVIDLTKAKITVHIEEEKAAAVDANENTQAIAAKAVQGILGRLGEGQTEGPYFRVIVGPDEGSRFSLSGTLTEWSLGRAKDCEFVLNDANVSRRHALVKKDWNGYTIQDLGSKNGVLINDRHIQKSRRLKDRDEVIVGPVKLLFIDPDAPLLEALKDVPGFGIEEPEAAESDPSHVGAPPEGESPPGGSPGADSLGAPGEAAPGAAGAPDAPVAAAPPADDEPDLSGIDPSLLQPASTSKLPVEWIVIGAAALLVFVVVGLILVLLS